jgi:hypothetical protein
VIGVGCESIATRVSEQGTPSVTDAGVIVMLTLIFGSDISKFRVQCTDRVAVSAVERRKEREGPSLLR